MKRDLSLRNTYVETNMNLNFTFKRALHCSILTIKLFNSSAKLFCDAIATATP